MRTVVPGPCPVCNEEVQYLYQTENIPYFSDILIIRGYCNACGFRYVDTQVLSSRAPGREKFLVETPDDMMVRVVRSMQGVIMIPEIGVRVDPGPACEGFISNVEGVLERVAKVAQGVATCGDETEQENARIFLGTIARIKDGQFPVTLIIDDPSGNSAIISDKTEHLPYPDTGENECGDE